MQQIYLPQPTEDMWKSISNDFDSRWNFPHCVGAIDGKHVGIKKPNQSGSSYFNYKHDFSIVLLSAVDANKKFTFIDVGSMGRFSDGSIFSSCELEKKMVMGNLKLPSPSQLPSFQHTLPYVFVGDEAFPLMVNLMRPYPRKNVTTNHENKVFNYRLSRARQTVECAFGILASRFRVVSRPFEIKVTTVVDVVKAACVMHNYLRRNASVNCENEEDEDIESLPTEQLIPVRRNQTRCVQAAFAIRKKFTQYFNSGGSVSWQEERVSQGQF
ncbi:protein ANTAGONIST OF LIKE HETEROCHROMATIN PROTEIN 1-like [Homalodisca vitripennis]|uniref:protein ANTAGONIST OF LIKE HETEROCHROMATIN PROTEIN 1-like n=1 Tax=Homalodisca vitripennis TaxID=197043 RepID=UPI001EEB74CD|nr:protein ANTAGONIST OF LIKE HETEROCHROMATIN PROTEIN 1-like [Homalodisca vitripennis]